MYFSIKALLISSNDSYDSLRSYSFSPDCQTSTLPKNGRQGHNNYLGSDYEGAFTPETKSRQPWVYVHLCTKFEDILSFQRYHIELDVQTDGLTGIPQTWCLWLWPLRRHNNLKSVWLSSQGSFTLNEILRLKWSFKWLSTSASRSSLCVFRLQFPQVPPKTCFLALIAIYIFG